MNSLLLSVETATLAGSLSVVKGTEVLASQVGDAKVSHSNTLLADIDRLLSGLQLRVQDIEVFAVAAGPGSFTGLRIGIATVKALATSLDRPCLGVPTLKAIAHSAGPSTRTVALLPAGRGEVFCQLFTMREGSEVIQLDEAAHLSPAKMIRKYSQFDDVIWAGEGAKLYADLINEAVRTKPAQIIKPFSSLAEHVALLANSELAKEANTSPNDLHAIYVRPSDAELKF